MGSGILFLTTNPYERLLTVIFVTAWFNEADYSGCDNSDERHNSGQE